MHDPLAALLLATLAVAVGLAPARALLARTRVEALALAPALGAALLALAAGWLVRAGLPVATWARPAATLGVLAGLLASLATARRGPPLAPAPRGDAAALAAAVGAGLLLGVAPLAAGGPGFALFRGNPHDQLHYVAMADALARVPLRDLQTAEPGALFAVDPRFPLVQGFLRERWVTPALLAWQARLRGLPALDCELAFSLLAAAAAVGPAFVLLRRAGAGAPLAAAAAATVGAGAWTSFVVDLRAQGHLSALPPLLLALAAWAGPPAAGRRVALGVAFAGLFLLYPELLVVVAPGLALAAALAAWRGQRAATAAAADLVAAGALAALLTAPLLRDQLNFLVAQLGKGAAEPARGMEWGAPYFAGPLFGQPHAGLWGLAAARNRLAAAGAGSLAGALAALAVALSGLGALQLLRVLAGRDRRRAAVVVAGLVAAGALPIALMAARGQWWSVGKGVSYVALLLPLHLALLAAPGPGSGGGSRRRWLTAAVAAWLGLQGLQALDRVALARRGEELPAWIAPTGLLRRFDPRVAPVTRHPALEAGRAVVLVPSPWQADLLLASLPPDAPRGVGAPNRGAAPAWVEASRRAPCDLLLVAPDGASQALLAAALGTTADAALVPAPGAWRGPAPVAAWCVAEEGPAGRVRLDVCASAGGPWTLTGRAHVQAPPDAAVEVRVGGAARVLLAGAAPFAWRLDLPPGFSTVWVEAPVPVRLTRVALAPGAPGGAPAAPDPGGGG